MRDSPETLNTFRYQAFSAWGEKVSGTLTASSRQHAAAQLSSKVSAIISIKRVSRVIPATAGQDAASMEPMIEPVSGLSRFFSGSLSILRKPSMRLNQRQQANLFQQLATVLESGIPLLTAVELLTSRGNDPQQVAVATALKAALNEGRPFATAMVDCSHGLAEVYVDLLALGESTGLLDRVCRTISTDLDKALRLQAKIKKALIYPAAVVVVALVVTVLLLLYVVPEFEAIFASFGSELPAFTQWVLGISGFIQNQGMLVLAVGSVAAIALQRLHSSNIQLQKWWFSCCLRFPVIGNILLRSSHARFAQTYVTALPAGMTLLSCSEAAIKATGHPYFSHQLGGMIARIEQGKSLVTVLSDARFLSEMDRQLIHLGEESGRLDIMFKRIADTAEDEVNQRVDNINALLEPIIMSVLGVVVGGLIISMYLPIFAMGSAF